SVNHSAKEYARGDVHNNTAESFNSTLERAKQGVFHYMSSKHLPRYLNEIGFRWDH
ncbi:ISSpo8, transposase, partial [Olavius algarvensis Delta 1 endosymbiont]